MRNSSFRNTSYTCLGRGIGKIEKMLENSSLTIPSVEGTHPSTSQPQQSRGIREAGGKPYWWVCLEKRNTPSFLSLQPLSLKSPKNNFPFRNNEIFDPARWNEIFWTKSTRRLLCNFSLSELFLSFFFFFARAPTESRGYREQTKLSCHTSGRIIMATYENDLWAAFVKPISQGAVWKPYACIIDRAYRVIERCTPASYQKTRVISPPFVTGRPSIPKKVTIIHRRVRSWNLRPPRTCEPGI